MSKGRQESLPGGGGYLATYLSSPRAALRPQCPSLQGLGSAPSSWEAQGLWVGGAQPPGASHSPGAPTFISLSVSKLAGASCPAPLYLKLGAEDERRGIQDRLG